MLSFYNELAASVVIDKQNNKLIQFDQSLTLAGVGRSAFVFKIKDTNKAIKVFFPQFNQIAQEEADIYNRIQHIDYYPTLYEAGPNYIVIDYIEGHTLFECLTLGIRISEDHIKEVDLALSLAENEGLTPSDIHLRNIFLTSQEEIKIIDVARFRQTKHYKQWEHLKRAFYRLYSISLFPKKIPAFILNLIAALYKKLYK
ncbi:protein kinase family protein [Bacillus sp. FJAT-50079]|uniref:protein kinase family protein n=1 Tax=Bacillus sp. FJAT-50079 TaxID=2833577 RepID=UPI001BC952F3|nr:protein kinase family protein [Bacillus sp. FJAT-50079]MBS4210208.1 protein kinase family protein [Bacillus sp. FJAT-50079]